MPDSSNIQVFSSPLVSMTFQAAKSSAVNVVNQPHRLTVFAADGLTTHAAVAINVISLFINVWINWINGRLMKMKAPDPWKAGSIYSGAKVIIILDFSKSKDQIFYDYPLIIPARLWAIVSRTAG